jgi:hypothetical protein
MSWLFDRIGGVRRGSRLSISRVCRDAGHRLMNELEADRPALRWGLSVT